MKYIPTYKLRCEYEDCKAYGKPLVDRGYGSPVCETTRWRSERYPGSNNIPMNPRYLEGAPVAYPTFNDTQYYCERCKKVFEYKYPDQCNCEGCGTQVLDNNIAEVRK